MPFVQACMGFIKRGCLSIVQHVLNYVRRLQLFEQCSVHGSALYVVCELLGLGTVICFGNGNPILETCQSKRAAVT